MSPVPERFLPLVFRGVEGGAGVGTGDLELLPSRGGHRDDGEEDDDARSTLSVWNRRREKRNT